ncbi:MAG: DUF342 domain-containing protein [Planctomycetota bacterium]
MADTATERLPLVRLLDGGREAVLEVPFEAAPELTTPDALVGLVRERGVLLDRSVDEAVRALAAQHASRAAGDAADVVGTVARWMEPVAGTDARIDWAPEFQPASAEVEGEDGVAPVDHYNRVKRLKVAAGQPLGVLAPPGEGSDGRDVCGRNIAARRGRKLALQPDGTVQVEADGTIRALKDGVLSLARLRIAIVDSLEVAGAVDFSTGNIDFVGSVKVADGVRDNFTLRATGDVTVRGLVEAADLVIGGDCTCERGVAARNSGHLLVDGSLEAAYLNGVRGRVRGSVRLDREIVGCELLVGGDLSVARGAIVGGALVVGGALKAASIGTEGGAKTTVRIGGMPLELLKAARIAELAKNLAKEAAPLEEREREIALKGDKASAAEKEAHTELAFEIAEVHRRVRMLEERRAAILRAAGEARTVKVDVEKAIHTGTVLLVGAREVKFTRTVKGPVQIGWDENRNLQFRVAGGKPQDLREVATVREAA